MTQRKTIFIFAGEPSGDLHGSNLLAALKSKIPDSTYLGVPGPLMRQHALEQILPTESFSVMGFKDVLASLPRLVKNFYTVRNSILKRQPDAVILIDYPGFNLRLADALRRKGYKGKIVHYISPTVWAWGKERITQMSKTLDLLLVILPFEEECFKGSGLKVTYVGHPLMEAIKNYNYRSFPTQEIDNLIAIFPGSRAAEITRNLPKQLAAAALYKKANPKAKFGVSCSSEEYLGLIFDIMQKSALSDDDIFLVSKNYSYELMRDCRSAIAKSGTVTLELAFHKKPTVVVYELSRFDRLYAKYYMKLKLPFYCIVNILAGKQVFPELIESGFNPENVAELLTKLDADGSERSQCIKECENILAKFEDKNASENAATAIAELLKC